MERCLTADAGYEAPTGSTIDPSVVRGLEYYTGPVFEAELTAPITDDRGQPIRLGSVVSGGRYDGLVERFTGEKVPGDRRLHRRLAAALRVEDPRQDPGRTAQGPVVVLVFQDQTASRIISVS